MDEKVDEEFRQILRIIKNSIENVDSSHKLNLYRSWLEKLNSNCYEKQLRNKYLLELARQVRGNFVAPPFDQQPEVDDENWCDISDSSTECVISKHQSDNTIVIKENNNSNSNEQGMKYTNSLVADWKCTVEGLQLRLTETVQQNEELKKIINELSNTIEEEKLITRENETYKLKLMEELEAIRSKENSLRLKLTEIERNYKKKLEELKINYESKLNKARLERKEAATDKDKEIFRLSEIISGQCNKISEEISSLKQQISNMVTHENSGEKIFVLQKCVSKMDKLFHKSEKEYIKLIDKLKKELEVKDKMMFIQMKTQRAEIIAKAYAEKQQQFDETISQMEMKFLKMMEFQQNEAEKVKKVEEEKVKYLRELLDKNGIKYNL